MKSEGPSEFCLACEEVSICLVPAKWPKFEPSVDHILKSSPSAEQFHHKCSAYLTPPALAAQVPPNIQNTRYKYSSTFDPYLPDDSPIVSYGQANGYHDQQVECDVTTAEAELDAMHGSESPSPVLGPCNQEQTQYFIPHTDEEESVLENCVPILRPPSFLVNGEVHYEVEEILDSREEDGQIEYLVRWLGYDDTENTWEPADNVFADECVAEYYLKNPDAP